MPGQPDGLTPEVAEQRFGAALAKQAQAKAGDDPENDQVKDTPDPPDWHKQGKGGPPGWRQVGDTWTDDPV